MHHGFRGCLMLGGRDYLKKDKKEQYESQVHFTPGKE
jgi:hypothetical protein